MRSPIGCVAAMVLLAALGCTVAWPQRAWSQVRMDGTCTSLGGVVTGAGLALASESSANVTVGRVGNAGSDLSAGAVAQASDLRMDASLVTPASAAFAMIAVPLAAGGGNLLGSLFDELGGSDDTRWRVGHFVPASRTYTSLTPADALPVGQGFWIVTQAPMTLNVRGLPPPPQDFAAALADSANAGAWNQLGNPFPFAVAIRSLRVRAGASSAALMSVNAMAESTLYVYDTAAGHYRQLTGVNTLGAYEGVWVRRKAGSASLGTVELVVPAVAAVPNTQPAPARPAGAAWAVRVVARQEGRASEPLHLGVAAVPTAGRNALCRPAAPASPGGGPRLVAHHDDWAEESGDYVAVFRAESEHAVFDFQVQAARAPGELLLSIEAEGLPAGSRLQLVNPRIDVARDVAPGDVIPLPARTDPVPLRLEVWAPGVEPRASAPFADALREAYPNPFAQSTGLTFTLARTSDAAIDVFDLSGRRIAGVELRSLPAGEHVWVWDGRGARGNAQPPGIYLARWRAGRAEGVRRLVKTHP